MSTSSNGTISPSSVQRTRPSIFIQKPPMIAINLCQSPKIYSVKVKPFLIAKKVSADDIFENPLKQSNIMVALSQINEEKTGELDEILGSYPNFSSKEDMSNVFKTEAISSAKYKEYSKGPVFKDGNLVKHSIVGSVEMFQRYQKRNKSKDFMINDKESSDTITIRSPKIGKTASQDVGSMSLSSRPGTQGTVPMRISSYSDKKRNAKNELKMTKEDITNELTKIKERNESLLKEETQKTIKQAWTETLATTKEERNLKKFSETTQDWQKTVEKYTNKVGRDVPSSVMLGGEKHRRKIEIAEILEAVRSDEERFGANLWYHTLRSPDNKVLTIKTPAKTSKYSTDILYTTETDRQLNSLEVVRKARLIQTAAETERSGEKILGVFGGEYLQEKLKAKKKILDVVRPPELEEVNGLSIRGRNKLDLEAEAMLRQTRSRDAVRVPLDFFEKKEKPKTEEMIIKNRHNLTILRQGLSAYYKD